MPKTILVVEDYDDNRRLYKYMLEELGFRVVEAGDGYEALEQVEKEKPDLILMDMAMPTMDGLAATRRIKDMPEKGNLPIIGVTAHGNFFNEKAMEAGCDSIITKPIEIKTLSAIISLYIEP